MKPMLNCTLPLRLPPQQLGQLAKQNLMHMETAVGPKQSWPG